MDEIDNLFAACHALGAKSATISNGVLQIFMRTDADLKLIARKLAVTPETRSEGSVHWLSITARRNGVQVYAAGPEHAMPVAPEAA